jgi:hypothetical protein
LAHEGFRLGQLFVQLIPGSPRFVGHGRLVYGLDVTGGVGGAGCVA